ncbi:MAG: glycosyltransferase [Candidatus Eremiobacteraeota bacterium]|nr:glycosyltransferase [Candidatus Eremiobacteraeota bacterium]
MRRLNAYVREALAHLARQTYRNFDVYVVTDEAETIAQDGLVVTCLSSGAVPPNYKRKMAAEQSDADVVALLDDDAYPVAEWLSSAVAHFENGDVVAVGGPGVTPPGDSPSQRASGAIYASPLVSADAVYRYLPLAPRDVDDYPSCNLLVRREPFLRHVQSCLRYWPGEDTKLCYLLTKVEHKRIVYEPRALVYHHRRNLFWGHFRQVWNYAVHRGFFAKRYPATSLRAQYFAPSTFVLGNLLALVALPFFPASRALLGGAALVYALLVASSAIGAQGRPRPNPTLVALGIYLTHLTYGVGFLVGLSRAELDH